MVFDLLCTSIDFVFDFGDIGNEMIKNIMIQEPLFWDKNFQNPISPKQLSIREIDCELASKLNSVWHSRLPKIPASNIFRNRYYVCFGAAYMGIWIACAIWSSPVNRNFDINTYLELRRLAISEYCPKNTATRMLSVMIKAIPKKFPLVKNLIPYQDTEVHNGTIYKAANWIVDGETKYTSWNKSRPSRKQSQSNANKIRWKYIIN